MHTIEPVVSVLEDRRCRVPFHSYFILRNTFDLWGVEAVIPQKFDGLRDSWGWWGLIFRQHKFATAVSLNDIYIYLYEMKFKMSL